MTLTYGVFKRKISFNPYSSVWALPGEIAPHKKQVEGVARRSILHALTYYQLPSQVDHKIEAFLPEETVLQTLNPLRKSYLSFTIYSLKQMVAAGTISAETAWSLFRGEWEQIDAVFAGSYGSMRRTFMGKVLGELERDFTEGRIETLSKELYMDETRGIDLLRFEFLARAGEAGLAQYEKYHLYLWCEGKLVFDPETCKDMTYTVRKEYMAALWLEQRIIEGEYVLSGLNEEIGTFRLNNLAGYYRSKNGPGVEGAIDLFSPKVSEQRGKTVDSTFKAEVGHWMFAMLQIKYSWVSELMDRMNMAGYCAKYIDGVLALRKTGMPDAALPPVLRVALEGGFYLSSRRLEMNEANAEFPSYPQEFPAGRENSKEEHEVAEKVERLIRKRIMRAKAEPAFEWYRKTGVYVALLALEGKDNDEILERLEVFNVEEISEYFATCRERAIAVYEERLSDNPPMTENFRSSAGRLLWLMENFGSAAERLLWLKDLSPDSAEYRRLYAYKLIGEGKLDRVPSDEYAIPALRDYLWVTGDVASIDRLEQIGGKSAIAVIEEAMRSGFTLTAARASEVMFWLMMKESGAVSADLESLRGRAIRLYQEFLEKHTSGGKYLAASRKVAARGLIKLKALEQGSTEYAELYAHVLIADAEADGRWEKVVLDERAIPALAAALKDERSSIRDRALTLLKIIGSQRAIEVIERGLKDGSCSFRADVADVLIRLKGLKPESAEYRQLDAFRIFYGAMVMESWEPRHKRLVALGKDALFAVVSAAKYDGDLKTRDRAREVEALIQTKIKDGWLKWVLKERLPNFHFHFSCRLGQRISFKIDL